MAASISPKPVSACVAKVTTALGTAIISDVTLSLPSACEKTRKPLFSGRLQEVCGTKIGPIQAGLRASGGLCDNLR